MIGEGGIDFFFLSSDGEFSVRHADFTVSMRYPGEISNEKLNLELRDLSLEMEIFRDLQHEGVDHGHGSGVRSPSKSME